MRIGEHKGLLSQAFFPGSAAGTCRSGGWMHTQVPLARGCPIQVLFGQGG